MTTKDQGEATPRVAPEYTGHGFARLNGARLYYQVRGKGPPIVLIHGGQLDCRVWDDQFKVLTGSYRVLRYDVRGFGGSVGRHKDRLYSDVDDLAALLDYVGMPSPHLVGLSLGGRIAIDFALTHPTRVGSLLTAGPGLTGFDLSDPALKPYDDAIDRAVYRQEPGKVVRAWLNHPYMEPAMQNASLARRIERIARENADAWFANLGLQQSPRPGGGTPARATRAEGPQARAPGRAGRVPDQEGRDGPGEGRRHPRRKNPGRRPHGQHGEAGRVQRAPPALPTIDAR
jgi:pimeloyl-ACP methyl ester carboxylesterase